MNKTAKILFIIAAMCAAMQPVLSQDTLHSRALPDRYYSHNWPDTDFIDTHQVYFYVSIGTPIGWSNAVIKYTEDSLTVYGIAASLVTPGYTHWYSPQALAEDAVYILDTSRAALLDEKLRLWEMTSTQVYQVGEDLTVKLSTEDPDYYWDLDLVSCNGIPYRVQPMYERYFSEPVVVVDSFLVGKQTVNGGSIHIEDEPYNKKNYDVNIFTFIPVNEDGSLYHSGSKSWTYEPKSDYPGTIADWSPDPFEMGYLLIFPIIAPNPDTVRGGDDNTTAAVRPLSAVERNTVVSPNPATGVVQVSSGFGLTAIEAYDATGTKVHEQSAEGLKARVDVSRWPRGTYLLRIHTPVGTATKRLVVQ